MGVLFCVMDDQLKKAYEDYPQKTSLRGVEALHGNVKNASRQDIKKWLSKSEPWSLFKQVNTRSRHRRRVHVFKKNETCIVTPPLQVCSFAFSP
jgi:hypothetical protein